MFELDDLLVVVGIILVILKLSGAITLAWWIVLAPFWILPVVWLVGLILSAVLGMLVIALALVLTILSDDEGRWRY